MSVFAFLCTLVLYFVAGFSFTQQKRIFKPATITTDNYRFVLVFHLYSLLCFCCCALLLFLYHFFFMLAVVFVKRVCLFFVFSFLVFLLRMCLRAVVCIRETSFCVWLKNIRFSIVCESVLFHRHQLVGWSQ